MLLSQIGERGRREKVAGSNSSTEGIKREGSDSVPRELPCCVLDLSKTTLGLIEEADRVNYNFPIKMSVEKKCHLRRIKKFVC